MTAPFDVCGPLPRGVTVLEASAGTGKTYTIAALAARYVAEGTPLERLLLVTFTRMATGELRERVRERLVAVERGLTTGESDDPVVRLLAGRPGAAERLRRALADFDAATIATTHGFCQEVLAGLGVVGDPDQDVTFVEDISDLREEVVDDLYVRRFANRDDPPPFDRSEAAEIARAAVENPVAPLARAAGAVPELRRRLAEAARTELEARKRRLGIMTYDDLLTRLDDALESPEAVARLRARYDVVLVDEFQDTDPVQWDILRRAFGAGDVTLVLIGDPKQAIYAFRGADVYAYLDAARTAGTQATLEVNRRSDQALIDAYDALFGGAQLGHPGIVYGRVRAADPERRAPGTPLRVRVLRRDEPGIELTRTGYSRKDTVVEHIVRDVAADIVSALDDAAPGDIAVLVPINRYALRIRDALEAAGVPAVINGAGSVFATGAAREWLALLRAIERPAMALRAHGAALTAFVGWSAERVAGAGEAEWEEVHGRLHEWARVLRERGVASLAETISAAEGLPARVLAEADGERRMTDLRHVGELLHAAAAADRLGAAALTAWLRRRIAEAERDAGNEERTRRLESDADAVQVLTVHRSKGLEFPIVYLPFMWEPGYVPRDPHPVTFHDAAAGDVRTLDVSLEGRDYDAHRAQEVDEQRGEDLRLTYVGLTRAEHRAVIWWAPAWEARHSPLGRLLFARAPDGTVAPSGTATPPDAAAFARLEALAADARGCVAVERSTLGPPARWGRPLPALSELAAAAFTRGLDVRWRRTSYSDITATAHEARVASEPEDDDIVDDERDALEAPAEASALPLGAMPAGARVGTFVHHVLEETDFAAADLAAELGGAIAAELARRPVDIGDRERVVAGLAAVLETPLGPLLGGAPLRSVARADRLDELAFELPLAGGDTPAGRLTLAAVAGVLRAHGDPLGYAERLEDPALRTDVRGYLTGSIDLVVRAGGRFALLDYKTNRLGRLGAPLTAGDYRPERLAAEMRDAHYGLQALLYAVALHRYLRWRLPGYDPDRHLAGVLYLFLRGMTGPETPVQDGLPYGVYAWRPPGALVSALSDAFEGE